MMSRSLLLLLNLVFVLSVVGCDKEAPPAEKKTTKATSEKKTDKKASEKKIDKKPAADQKAAPKAAADTEKPKPPPTTGGGGHGLSTATPESVTGTLKSLGYSVMGTPAVSEQMGVKTVAITFKKGAQVGAVMLYRSPTGEHLDALVKKSEIATAVRSGNQVVVVRLPGDAAPRQAILDEIKNGK